MDTLQKLQQKNPNRRIHTLSEPVFADYGVTYDQYDIRPLAALMQSVNIPTSPNLYVPSNPRIEQLQVVQQIGADVYAGLPIEAGECAGHANALTAVEFHQGSELNVFFTDVVMVIGKRGQMQHGEFNAPRDAKLFYVPAGTVVEFFSDTLHYSPCEVHRSGFKFIVMLVRGSNQPFPANYHTTNPLIVKQNKFQVVHKSRVDKIKQGIKVGVTGELVNVTPID